MVYMKLGGFFMKDFFSTEELKQRFGSDYKLAYRVIILDYLFMFSLSLILIIHIYFKLEISLFYLFLPIIILANINNRYGVKKVNLRERLKGSKFNKRVETPLRILFVLIILSVLVTGFVKNSEETQSIKEAIVDFGYDVKAPTNIPFKPTKEYGWIDKGLDQLQISYQKRFSTELVIYVTPQKPEYFDETGEKIHIFNNNIGFYSVSDSGDPRLDWEMDGLYYSLEYVSPDPPSKSEFLDIVNSME